MRRAFLILACLPALAGSARAAERADRGQTCAGSNSQKIDCLKAQTAAWDQRLNIAYQAALDAAPPNQAAQLRAAERLWIQYRQANCLYYSLSANAGAQLGADSCERNMTENRAEELEGASSTDVAPAASGYPMAAGSWGGMVRAGPGQGYAQVGDLKEGEKVVLVQKSNVIKDDYPWFKIQFTGEGFMWGGILCSTGQPSPDVYKTCP